MRHGLSPWRPETNRRWLDNGRLNEIARRERLLNKGLVPNGVDIFRTCLGERTDNRYVAQKDLA